MTTPVIMLLLMTLPYLATRAASVILRRDFDGQGAAVISLGSLFAFTAVGHFALTEPMTRMLPPWVPERTLLVYATGVLELAIAIGFFVPRARRLAGWHAAVALVAFFPANIYAAVNHAPMGGHVWGPVYLLIRTPLQAFILIWLYWFALRRPDQTPHANLQRSGTATPRPVTLR